MASLRLPNDLAGHQTGAPNVIQLSWPGLPHRAREADLGRLGHMRRATRPRTLYSTGVVKL